MTAKRQAPATGADEGLAALSDAIESGAGLPAVARAAAATLDASLVLIDRSSAVLAVAAATGDEEAKLIAAGTGIETLELSVAEEVVGEMRWRARGDEPPPAAMLRMVGTLIALELERARSPQWASDEAATGFVRDLLAREITGEGEIQARASELGADLAAGGGVLIARLHPRSAQTGEWRARALTVAVRAVRAVSPGAIVAEGEIPGDGAEIVAVVPTDDAGRLARAAGSLATELGHELAGFSTYIAHSRLAESGDDVFRAGQEARLAANVGEAEGHEMLAFEDTGAYRLLLPAMSEDPDELRRFYAETVEPLADYDEQYETGLLATVEAYLDNDGNVAATAQQLFTHRHTIRYRLERAKELCGHDVTSTAGREKLGLGLKSMRVLGIAAPSGPAQEPGSSAGKAKRRS